jgi:hypothetical protein
MARQVCHDIPLPSGEDRPKRIGSRYVGEAGEGFCFTGLEFIRPSSPFASLGYFSRREKNVLAHPPLLRIVTAGDATSSRREKNAWFFEAPSVL